MNGEGNIVKCLLTSLMLSMAFAVPPGLAADSYPNKPVRFIVPFPPGGGTDAFARIVGAKLTEIWGQQVIIDNRSGAQGNIGTALGARATPDGYTLMLAHQGALVINPHLYGKPGFDTIRDFAAVSRGMTSAAVLVVHPSVTAKSMKDLGSVMKIVTPRLKGQAEGKAISDEVKVQLGKLG